jgi:hypothetical protein
VRYNTPIGAPIEADFSRGDDFTTVELSQKRDAISISGTSICSLHAALLLQSHLSIPLRIVDTDYSFDLTLSDFSSIDELQSAINHARAI